MLMLVFKDAGVVPKMESPSEIAPPLFNGTENPKPSRNQMEKVCSSKRETAFTSSPPTEFVIYDHS